MKARNLMVNVFATFTLVTLGTAWGQSLDFITPHETTGLFGITQNQTARLNVVRDDPFFRVELTFVDDDGNILAQKVHELAEAQSAFLELRGRDAPRTDIQRTQMRALVRFVGTPDTRTYMWTPTVEVFDSESGETRFLPAVQKVQKVLE